MSQQKSRSLELTPQSRRLRIAPTALLYTMLGTELLLLVSAKLPWLPRQRDEPWAVLACLILTGGVVLTLALWFIIARIAQRPFQFSLRTLLVLVVVVAIACGWFATALDRARKQTALIAAATKLNCGTLYEYNLSDTGSVTFFSDQVPGARRLQTLLGHNFFHKVVGAAPKTDVALQLFNNQISLRKLFLDNSQITNAGLSALDRLTQLEWVDLRDAPAVSDDGLQHFAGLTNLRELLLRRTSVGDASMAHLKNLKQLRNLDLGMTQVTDAGLLQLSSLTELRQLTFWGNKITDKGLAAVIPMTNLERLDLGGATITDAGVEQLAGLSHLEFLGLRGSPISDAGIPSITKLAQLHSLDLYNTKITDEGLLQLATLQQLETLQVGATSATDDGVKQLQQLLPNCKIQR